MQKYLRSSCLLHIFDRHNKRIRYAENRRSGPVLRRHRPEWRYYTLKRFQRTQARAVLLPQGQHSGMHSRSLRPARQLSPLHRTGICSRRSQASHQRFIAKYSLPFPLISDPDTAILQAYDAWGEKKNYGKVSMGTLRKTYVIDENGVIKDIVSKVDTKNHTAQILK